MNRVGVPRHRFVAVLLGGVLAIALPTVLALATDGPAPPLASAAPAASAAVDGCAPGTGTAQECQRRAKDFAARAVLSETDRAAARSRLPDARRAIGSAACTEGGCQRAEVQPGGGPAPDPVELELSRRALTAAGFDDVVVRRARPDDPAPAGTVVYAAAVGPACIVIVRSDPDRLGDELILGKLPGDHCLAP